ncbi:hypothetical protein SPI_07874 [Niveomyces insectorum RCEF 264]|uniref:Uncharacterized protein n=1 Tax=Niveomyces insectorum RCEF 264 TaxID=1081102 RepID=A0A167P3X9_9HYPO|nr:hypothetical protein SPI_07874 [Niveomyces insectorum RCEF 264]
MVRWPFTQFCPWQHGKVLLIEQNGLSHFEQRFADGRLLKPQRLSDCAVYGLGYVAILAPCTVPGDGRVAMLVAQWFRSATDPPHPAPATQEQSLLWMGGHCLPYPVAVSKTHRPRGPQNPPFPFSISHIAWAGRMLFFLSNDSCEENGDSVPLRPAIYRMGGEPEEDKDRNETYSRVYGGGGGDDDDGSQILSIGGAGDDLLVHERDAAGDGTLHLLHAGRTLWKHKEGIVEAVATKPQNGNGPVFAAIISSPAGDDQPGEVFSIVAAADTTGPGERVQLSDHGSVALTDQASFCTDLPYRLRYGAPAEPAG